MTARICLVFDYLGRALVGSTDTKADNPDTVRCEQDEVEYFLASVRALMPGVKVDRDQIVYAYSGIRPLPASDASIAGLISRDQLGAGDRAGSDTAVRNHIADWRQMDHLPGLCGGSCRYSAQAARPHPAPSAPARCRSAAAGIFQRMQKRGRNGWRRHRPLAQSICRGSTRF